MQLAVPCASILFFNKSALIAYLNSNIFELLFHPKRPLILLKTFLMNLVRICMSKHIEMDYSLCTTDAYLWLQQTLLK